MAEPIRPAGEADDTGRPAADAPAEDPAAAAPSQPPVARRVEPDDSRSVQEDHPAAVDRPAEPAPAVQPAPAVSHEERTDEDRAAHDRAAHDRAPAASAEGSALLPPKKRGNRLVATAWVLLAAGLFQVVFFGANALVALVFGGTAAVVPQVQSIAATSLAWLPVLLFFLLFELTALLVNRAGRVAYVLASLIVAAVVYVLTVLLFSVIVRHTLGDANTLAQTFLNWEFILVGLVSREVMLWTGLAIGSRGIRVRRRNREARRRYTEEVADVRG